VIYSVEIRAPCSRPLSIAIENRGIYRVGVIGATAIIEIEDEQLWSFTLLQVKFNRFSIKINVSRYF